MANPAGAHLQRLHQLHQLHQMPANSLPGELGKPASATGSLHRPTYLDHQRQDGQLAERNCPTSADRQLYQRDHQRRQSVARLLPDISKLRLLSWLVEASSELVNCDIAIMDGVYAKLNRSQESLLFWQQSGASSSGAQARAPQRPPPPARQPVAACASNVISVQQQQQQQQQKLNKKQPSQPEQKKPKAAKRKQHQQANQPPDGQQSKSSKHQPRSHHSLPVTNYDASSLAAVSLSPSLGFDSRRSLGAGASALAAGKPPAKGARDKRGQAGANRALYCDSDDHPSEPEEGDEEDDDDRCSAASSSSTSSSGIHGGGTSISSTVSTCSSNSSRNSSSTSSCCSSSYGDFAGVSLPADLNNVQRQLGSSQRHNGAQMSSAELISEKIRRSVMEHNYLQALLVNIIRQHDRQRDLLSRQQAHQRRRIDLAEISDALDDGCLCICHESLRSLGHKQLTKASTLPSGSGGGGGAGSNTSNSQHWALFGPASSKTAPPGAHPPPQRKARRLKAKIRGQTGQTDELNREDLLQLMGDKVCENCFETHYWLHGCQALELRPPASRQPPANGQLLSARDSTTAASDTSSSSLPVGTTNQMNASQAFATATSSTTTIASLACEQQLDGNASNTTNHNNASNNNNNSADLQDLNSLIGRRNATFIKLVQQQVRSTINKSIELIDLIRKEIKSPESIKHKQLMRCFAASIQLLTSASNYVVPSQDISTFIPVEVGQQQAQLFTLPTSDFDHLFLYPSPVGPFGHKQQSAQQQQRQLDNYHLASAPDLPVRRRTPVLQTRSASTSASESPRLSGTTPVGNHRASAYAVLSSNLQRLRTTDDSLGAFGKQIQSADANPSTIVGQLTASANAESSSGASSNNSSASSSMARGAIQSSLTRAQTCGSILDGKTSHDLSFEAIVASSFSRQQTEDDILARHSSSSLSRAKFWQSSRFNFIKKLLHVKQQRLLRQQSKDRRIYNNKVQNKFRLVMMDLTHFNKSQQLLTTENGVNSMLTSMRNVLEFGLYLTLKLY